MRDATRANSVLNVSAIRYAGNAVQKPSWQHSVATINSRDTEHDWLSRNKIKNARLPGQRLEMLLVPREAREDLRLLRPKCCSAAGYTTHWAPALELAGTAVDLQNRGRVAISPGGDKLAASVPSEMRIH